MKHKRVLLFRTDPDITFPVTLLPVGLGFLSASLAQAGVDHRVVDMVVGFGEDDLIEAIREYQPDLVGASLISFYYRDAYRLLAKIKESFPDTDICAGGPHVSMFRDQVLQECQAVDYAVVKEGEKALVALVEGKAPQEIKGVYYREEGKISFSGEPGNISDLDSLPYPRFEKFEIEKYSPIIPIYSSRGCPYRCTFCGIKDVIGYGFRANSNEYLIDEVKYWYERGFRKLAFSDDNFTCKPKRIFEFCEMLKSNGLTEIDFSVWDTRADSTSRELLIAMKEIGFKTLLVGAESASNRMLKIIKKGETIEDIERMVKDACELGFDVQLSFLIGSPLETVEEVESSFAFALKYPIKGVSFFNIVPTPNTEMLQYLEEHGCMRVDPEDYLNTSINSQREIPLFETPEIPYQERVGLLKKSERVAHQVIKNYWLHKFGLSKYGILGRTAVDIALYKPVYQFITGNDTIKAAVKSLARF